MSNIKTIEGHFKSSKARYCIVAARFNSFIVDSLIQGALDTLHRHGVSDEQIHIVRVPGAFEMPLALKKAATTMPCDALIALGAIIRGGTPHFDYVAGACTQGAAQVMMETGKPIAFGVLTTDTIEQAIERAGTKSGNKGADAALTAIEMVDLLKAMTHE